MKGKISKDVLTGKTAQIPGAGAVNVCRCEHTGTAKPLKALALIWKYFANGKSARFAAKKIFFAVRSLQRLASRGKYCKNPVMYFLGQTLITHNPTPTFLPTFPAKQHIAEHPAHTSSKSIFSPNCFSVSPGSPTANGMVLPLCQLYPEPTQTKLQILSFLPQKQKQLQGTHLVQQQRTNLSSFPSFACTSAKHKYTAESLQPHKMGAGVIKHCDKHRADGFACAHRAGSPMPPPCPKKEQFAPEPTQTSAD